MKNKNFLIAKLKEEEKKNVFLKNNSPFRSSRVIMGDGIKSSRSTVLLESDGFKTTKTIGSTVKMFERGNQQNKVNINKFTAQKSENDLNDRFVKYN